MNVITKIITTLFTISIITVNANNFFESGKSNREIGSTRNDTIVKQFKRHGLLYVDKKIKSKIISRYIYLGDKLFYKYPVTKENVGQGAMKLLSGNNFLKVGVTDTILFTNYILPPMNMSTYMRGGQIRRLSDSSYLVKSNSKVGTSAVFVIMASDNYEEIKNRPGFTVDSLVLIVK